MTPQDVAHTRQLLSSRAHLIENHEQVDVGFGMRISSCPGPEEQHPLEAIAIEARQLGGDAPCDLVDVQWSLSKLDKGQIGERSSSHVGLNQAASVQPFDSTPFHTGVVEDEPRLAQDREFQKCVLEAPKRAATGK